MGRMAVQKISVSLPEELVQEARDRVGVGGVSGLLAESLEKELRARRLKDALDAFDQEFGPPMQKDYAQAEKWLKD